MYAWSAMCTSAKVLHAIVISKIDEELERAGARDAFQPEQCLHRAAISLDMASCTMFTISPSSPPITRSVTAALRVCSRASAEAKKSLNWLGSSRCEPVLQATRISPAGAMFTAV